MQQHHYDRSNGLPNMCRYLYADPLPRFQRVPACCAIPRSGAERAAAISVTFRQWGQREVECDIFRNKK